MPDAKYCSAPMLLPDGSCAVCGRPTAAPAQAEPRDDHSLDYIADEYAAPSPAAEDGDSLWLRCCGDDEMARGNVSNAQRFIEIAARIERQAQEIERLTLERDTQRDITDREAARADAALRRAEALHTALRKQVLGHKYTPATPEPKRHVVWCDLCEVEWTNGDPEPAHAEGCLASPAETKE